MGRGATGYLPRNTLKKIMNDITLNENGDAAIVDGKEYPVHGFDYAGSEAITIPALDLISYDDGDSWGDLE